MQTQTIFRCNLENYTLYSHDRDTHGGGVAIAVRNNIRHELLSVLATNSIENISISIFIGQTKIRNTSAYSSQQSNHFNNDIDILMSGNEEYLIFGRFQCQTYRLALFNKQSSLRREPFYDRPTNYKSVALDYLISDHLLPN